MKGNRVKVLLTGCKGQVGHCLVSQLNDRAEIELFAYDVDQLDITNEHDVLNKVTTLAPDVIINAAAHTAVDKAEQERELSDAINRDGPAYLAKAAEKVNALLLHISTDYVFDGKKCEPYNEDDPVNPQSVYGQSKLAGEQAVATHCTHYAILRTSWVFGEHGNNFVKTMLKLAATKDELGIIGDQYGGPTYAGDIATALIGMMDQMMNTSQQRSGIYHFSGEPHVSWYQFATAIFNEAESQQLLPKRPRVNELTTEQYPTPAPRPANSRLNCQKIKETFGIAPSNWQQALKNIKEYFS